MENQWTIKVQIGFDIHMFENDARRNVYELCTRVFTHPVAIDRRAYFTNRSWTRPIIKHYS